MCVDFIDSDDPDVFRPTVAFADARRRLRITVDQLPASLGRLPHPGNFSPGLTGAISARQLQAHGADVINAHWTGFGFASIAQLGRIRTPLVMTMHDMWAFTGGRFYDREDSSAPWRTGPENADPAARMTAVEAWTWRRKARHWRTPRHIITPSAWLAELVRQSPLLADWPVSVIPNALDPDVFHPIDDARARLGIPADGPLVLFALASDLTDPRKGWDLLREALLRLRVSMPDIRLAVVGHDSPPAEWTTELPRTHWLGRISDDHVMATAYSAADVVAVPSRQDNLPQTGTEAAACGTAVVAFRVGGLPDIVDHEVTGYLARPEDVHDLAEGIAWALSDSERCRSLGRAARSKAVRLWSPEVVAAQHAALFEDIRRPQRLL